MASLEAAEIAYGNAWYEVRAKRSHLRSLKQLRPALAGSVFVLALALFVFTAIIGGNLYVTGSIAAVALAATGLLVWREPLRSEKRLHEAERLYVEAQKQWVATYGLQPSLSNVTALRFPWFPEERNAYPFGTAELRNSHTGLLTTVTLSRDGAGAYVLYDEAGEPVPRVTPQEQ